MSLRNISIFVREPSPGHYHWVPREGTEDAGVWTEVQASVESFPTSSEAFDAGNVALLKLVHERIGPRTPCEDEDASPVG
jgi:hypothetical protein